MKNRTDTIAAISTAIGSAGIAIVRVSGPDSLDIADRIFKCSGTVPSKRMAGIFVHGFIRTNKETKEDLDEVILLIYRAPHSYTKEDVVEFQGHGGGACARRILRAALEAGARSAEPGEFTKRAFLNGRIDLLQAEAVADLIMARSDRAASAAMEQLEGSLSASFNDTYENLINAAGDLEASLDFPEEDLPPSLLEGARSQIELAKKQLLELLTTWEEGHLLREGALVVISGKPNVGKSTLLNALLGRDRAIVTDTPGTTRDTIEEEIILNGVPLRLVDTAGLRHTDNPVESKGVQRAEDCIRKADLNLVMFDGSISLDNSNTMEMRNIDPQKSVIILNKIDLGKKTLPDNFPGHKVATTSLINGDGTQPIREAIIEQLGIRFAPAPHATISERHRQVVQTVLSKLHDIIEILHGDKEELLVPAMSTLRSAIELLDTITGKSYDKTLLDNIFSRFCIGK